MKRKRILFFVAVFALVILYSCPVSAATKKIGKVVIKDVITCEETGDTYTIQGKFERSGWFEKYIYPGTTLKVPDSDEIVEAAGIVKEDRVTIKKKFSGTSSTFTVTVPYRVKEKAVFDALIEEDHSFLGGGIGGGIGNPSGFYYYAYNVKVLNSSGKSQSGYSISKKVTDYTGKKVVMTEKTTATEGAYLSDFDKGWISSVDMVLGYVPSATHEDDGYGNNIAVMGGFKSDTTTPLTVKDKNGKVIATIKPKDLSDRLYYGFMDEVVIDNSYFSITASDDYDVTISNRNGKEFDWDYPKLYITVKQKKTILGKKATVVKDIYKYDGNVKKPTVKIEGLTINKHFKITGYKNNKSVGTASVTVKGIGDYTGTRTLNFKIRKPIKVTFNLNGTGSISVKSKEYLIGEKYGDLPTPKRSGWTFTGWYDKKISGTKVTENSVVKEGTKRTLYAGWAKNYKVTLYGNGGTVNGSTKKSYTIAYGTKLSTVYNKAEPKRTGYKFIGWYWKKGKSDEIKGTRKFNWILDVNLYAHWEPIKYKVSYQKNADKATGTMATTSFTYGKTTALRKNAFKRTGYSFSSWNTKTDGTGKSYSNRQEVKNLTSVSGKTVKLYVKWRANDYFVKFDKGAEKATGKMEILKASYDKAITLPKCEFKYNNKVFAGWNVNGKICSSGEKVKNLTTKKNGIFTIKATWRNPIKVSQISFSAKKLVLLPNESLNLNKYLVIAPENADNKKVTWTSSNTNAVTVKEGVIKPVKEGETVTITATTKDGTKKSATISIYVKTQAEIKRDAIVDEAEFWYKKGQFKYTWGGFAKLDRNKASDTVYKVDCSGFTSSIYYKVIGKKLSSSASGQKGNGKVISFERENYNDLYNKLKPGDLILIDNGKRLLKTTTTAPDIGHVGIYVGNGYMIHMGTNGVMKSHIKDGTIYKKNAWYVIDGNRTKFSYMNIGYIVRVIQ